MSDTQRRRGLRRLCWQCREAEKAGPGHPACHWTCRCPWAAIPPRQDLRPPAWREPRLQIDNHQQQGPQQRPPTPPRLAGGWANNNNCCAGGWANNDNRGVAGNDNYHQRPQHRSAAAGGLQGGRPVGATAAGPRDRQRSTTAAILEQCAAAAASGQQHSGPHAVPGCSGSSDKSSSDRGREWSPIRHPSPSPAAYLAHPASPCGPGGSAAA